MKLAPLDYACPATLAEAVSLLAASDGSAKLISGGQSLMPLLAFRLAAPSLIVDMRLLAGLGEIKIGDDGVRLGAKVRWRDIEAHPELRQAHPLLVAAIEHVAHYQIRNRGTVGGSLAHADPAAEMAGVAVACDAEIHVIGPTGSRVVTAGDFFVGVLTTQLASDEVITEVRLPKWPDNRRWAFEELARRRGDFALAGIALFYDEDAQGRAVNTHIGVIGVGSRPARLSTAEAALNGKTVGPATISAAARAAAAEVEPQTDIHGTAAYRRSLVATLLERCLTRASLRHENLKQR